MQFRATRETARICRTVGSTRIVLGGATEHRRAVAYDVWHAPRSPAAYEAVCIVCECFRIYRTTNKIIKTAIKKINIHSNQTNWNEAYLVKTMQSWFDHIQTSSFSPDLLICHSPPLVLEFSTFNVLGLMNWYWNSSVKPSYGELIVSFRVFSSINSIWYCFT